MTIVKMNITIKKDRAMNDLCDLMNTDYKILSLRIIQNALAIGFIHDDEIYCGANLYDILHENGISLNTATNLCLGSSDLFLTADFRELIIWGISDDCPNCGCFMDFVDGDCHGKYQWIARKCTNCKTIESNEPAWDEMPGGQDYNN